MGTSPPHDVTSIGSAGPNDEHCNLVTKPVFGDLRRPLLRLYVVNETRHPARPIEVHSMWISVAERAIVVSVIAAVLAAVLWQVGVGASVIVVGCIIGASIAGWVQPAQQRLAVVPVGTSRRLR